MWPKFSTSARAAFDSSRVLKGRSRNFGGDAVEVRVDVGTRQTRAWQYRAAEVTASVLTDPDDATCSEAEAENFGHKGRNFDRIRNSRSPARCARPARGASGGRCRGDSCQRA